MISIFIIIFFYFLISYIISCLFALQLRSITQMISYGFECGFISFISSLFRFRISYFIIIFNFLLFEIEFLLILLFIFSYSSYFISLFLLFLLLILLFDLYYFYSLSFIISLFNLIVSSLSMLILYLYFLLGLALYVVQFYLILV